MRSEPEMISLLIVLAYFIYAKITREEGNFSYLGMLMRYYFHSWFYLVYILAVRLIALSIDVHTRKGFLRACCNDTIS